MGALSVITSLLILRSVYGLLGDDDMELIQTPHGYRPSRCIIRHDESPVEITESKDGSGVYAYYPNSDRTLFFEADQVCIDNANELFAPRNDTNGGSYGLQGIFYILHIF